MYITPITKIHSNFLEAKEFYEDRAGLMFFHDEQPLRVSDLAQGKRNIIVGEPGVGKSLLLQKIKEHLDDVGSANELITLRQNNASACIDEFLSSATNAPKVLLLDALDEVQSHLFPSVLQKIEEVSKEYPDLPIYLSARWIFISRYASSFSGYRFITISPFTTGQVREYLFAAGWAEAEVETLLNRVMSFNHRMLVVQIPRYLFYLDDFVKKKGVDAAEHVSRNELFEHFIYSKLELEDKKLNADKRAITKRLLEKLALTMEIYQSNTISKDRVDDLF